MDDPARLPQPTQFSEEPEKAMVRAILLDVGGVFHLPTERKVRDALDCRALAVDVGVSAGQLDTAIARLVASFHDPGRVAGPHRGGRLHAAGAQGERPEAGHRIQRRWRAAGFINAGVDQSG